MTEHQLAAPQSLEAEQAVLGACLFSGVTVLEPLIAEAGLRPGHFYRPQHATIFEAMIALADRGDGIDHLTVRNELDRMGKLEAAGGPVAVEVLIAAPPVVPHHRRYALDVIEAARWRSRLTATYAKQQAIAERDEAAYLAVDDTDEPERATALDQAALAARFDAWLEASHDTVPCPWPQINTALHGGARRGDTSVIAGWTNMGKSIAAVGWLDHIAQQDGRVGLYTNEMAAEDVTARLLAGHSGVNFGRIMSRQLTDAQRTLVRGAYAKLKVRIIPAYGWPWQDIARHIRRHRWDLACLDLFNRLPDLEKVAQIDAAISGLCNAAAQSNGHVIVVSQLNQERSKTAERPMPTQRDLRGSGAMANDPANVVFIHRDQETDPDTDIVKKLDEGVVFLDKARNGRPGIACPVWLNESRMRFETEGEWRQRPDLEMAA